MLAHDSKICSSGFLVCQQYSQGNCLPERARRYKTDHLICHLDADNIDHCLHAIHKSVMCYADTGLITYQYKKGVSKPLTVTNAQRMCIDWEKFHGWAVSVGTGPGPTLWRPSEA